MVEFVYHGKKILFTSDLGNSPSPLLPDAEKVTDADYLIIESVYGDLNHEPHAVRRDALEEAIKQNYQRKGTLIIPVFSLERSQELLFELNALVEKKRIPIMPIFFDSPLAIRLTEVFKKYRVVKDINYAVVIDVSRQITLRNRNSSWCARFKSVSCTNVSCSYFSTCGE